METYNYDPGKYKDFDPFKNINTKILARLDWNINKDHKFTIRYNDVVGTSDQQTNANSGPPNNATKLRPYQQPVNGFLKCILRI